MRFIYIPRAATRPPAVLGLLALLTATPMQTAFADELVERGRYLVSIAGCNDCHTAGYMMTEGQVPESEWLMGDGLGWNGPWGTTYASNLRLFFASLSEDQWVETGRTLKRRPPMPWFNVTAMTDEDLRAIYRFTRSLGDPGEPAPSYLPPGETPPQPYATFPAPPPQ